MKKITITIKDKPDDEDNCTVNVKMEDSKNATESEKVMASNVYHAVLDKLNELSEIKN